MSLGPQECSSFCDYILYNPNGSTVGLVVKKRKSSVYWEELRNVANNLKRQYKSCVVVIYWGNFISFLKFRIVLGPVRFELSSLDNPSKKFVSWDYSEEDDLLVNTSLIDVEKEKEKIAYLFKKISDLSYPERKIERKRNLTEI